MFFGLLGFILGTILGSLALALADRSLENKTFFGRSRCPNCKHKLAWFDLIPIFSYLNLKGRCHYCHKKIKLEYLLVEIVVGSLIAILFWQTFSNFPRFNPADTFYYQYQVVNFFAELIAKTFLITILVIVAITDLKKTLIPDRITFPALKVILVYLLILVGYRIWYLYTGLSQNQIGNYLIHQTDYFYRHSLYIAEPLLSGLTMMLIVGLFFLVLIIITRGRGMGGGDLKLGILIGLFFGFPNAAAAILLSFLSGSIIAIALILLGKKQFGQTIPFGPFLSLGAILTIFWGEQITKFYLTLSPINFPTLNF